MLLFYMLAELSFYRFTLELAWAVFAMFKFSYELELGLLSILYTTRSVLVGDIIVGLLKLVILPLLTKLLSITLIWYYPGQGLMSLGFVQRRIGGGAINPPVTLVLVTFFVLLAL